MFSSPDNICSKDYPFSEEIPFLQGHKAIEKPCTVAHTCNVSTWEVEPRGSSLQGKPGLHSIGKVRPRKEDQAIRRQEH